MKQRSTNFLAYSFQLFAVLLLFGYMPQNKMEKTAAGIMMRAKKPAVSIQSVQLKLLFHPLQLPFFVNTVYW